MKFNLSSKEFLFLCFAVGAKQVYGIEDSFAKLSADDMQSEIRKVHSSLEKKEYIDTDFDGNTTFNNELLDFIKICANPKKLVMMNTFKSGALRSVNYYFDIDFSLKVIKQGDNYILSDFAKSSFSDELLSQLKLKSSSGFSDNLETVLLIKDLLKAKEALKSGDTREALSLLDAKLNEDVLKAVISALLENENVYSLAVIDFDSSKNNFESIVIIDTDSGALAAKPCIVGLENGVRIISCECDEIKTYIDRLNKKI